MMFIDQLIFVSKKISIANLHILYVEHILYKDPSPKRTLFVLKSKCKTPRAILQI